MRRIRKRRLRTMTAITIRLFVITLFIGALLASCITALFTEMSGKPIEVVVRELAPYCVVILCLFVLCMGILLHSIKHNLIDPLEGASCVMSEGWDTLYLLDELLPRWREPYELNQNYEQIKDKLHREHNEVIRLNTALNYAKNAEQNRKVMMSNIAHELKTPIAVIHSYAEGLKENIAQEKKDRYLDIILNESERLDDMVLELLDLSRLEAGRVKLARDRFALSKLVRDVFERLEMTMAAKGLKVTYDFPDDCIVNADEARIWQVVENFATNAVKYTPEGGRIHAQIQSRHGKVTFTIENDSEPLSDEALEKVWDAFYRADGTRTGNGTGLGLAIAKHIVQLHGGSCSVQNTGTGVRFRFTLPHGVN